MISPTPTPLSLMQAAMVLRRESGRCLALSARHFACARRKEVLGLFDSAAVSRRDGAIYAAEADRVERQAVELEAEAERMSKS